MISILIVDDHRMFAQSLARLVALEADMEVVGTAFTAADAVTAATERRPDVCLLDYALPDRDGASLATELRRLLPGVRIAMLTGVTRPSTAKAARAAGCDAFISKDDAADDLVDTIRRVAAGETDISHDIAAALRESTEAAVNYGLTNRELEVLGMMAQGSSTADIAETFVVSNNTVRTHVQRIITKLGAHSKLEAVAVARSAGLV